LIEEFRREEKEGGGKKRKGAITSERRRGKGRREGFPRSVSSSILLPQDQQRQKRKKKNLSKGKKRKIKKEMEAMAKLFQSSSLLIQRGGEGKGKGEKEIEGGERGEGATLSQPPPALSPSFFFLAGFLARGREGGEEGKRFLLKKKREGEGRGNEKNLCLSQPFLPSPCRAGKGKREKKGTTSKGRGKKRSDIKTFYYL